MKKKLTKKYFPWMAPSAVTVLEDEIIKPDFIAFEWGSGGSTLWLAHRCKSVVTIEHDLGWFGKVSADLDNCKVEHVEMHYVPKDSGSHEYDDYAKTILEFPDDVFDLVFVDGRNRAECVKRAVPKVKPGGYLVLDDAQREEYQDGIALLVDWENSAYKMDDPEGKTTTIFRKPSEELSENLPSSS